MLTGLLSPCPESVCLGLDDPPMDPVPPPRESNKEKKDIKAQNLRREKPRQTPLLPAVVTKPQDPKENVTAEKDEDCDIEEIICESAILLGVKDLEKCRARVSMG